jgi:hypothetical protein
VRLGTGRGKEESGSAVGKRRVARKEAACSRDVLTVHDVLASEWVSLRLGRGRECAMGDDGIGSR